MKTIIISILLSNQFDPRQLIVSGVVCAALLVAGLIAWVVKMRREKNAQILARQNISAPEGDYRRKKVEYAEIYENKLKQGFTIEIKHSVKNSDLMILRIIPPHWFEDHGEDATTGIKKLISDVISVEVKDGNELILTKTKEGNWDNMQNYILRYFFAYLHLIQKS